MAYIANITRTKGDPTILSTGPSSLGTTDRMGRFLGWFSIGLGVVELCAPRRITRALGMNGNEALVRTYGVREIGSGILSLSVDRQVGLWSRVAGDGLDVAALMATFRADNPKRHNVGLALAMVLGLTLLDVLGAQANLGRHSRQRGTQRKYPNRSGFPGGVEKARDAAKQSKKPARGPEENDP
jgi:hypothetical protein